jgi:hypothetical protein
LYREAADLAYHFHWNKNDIFNMTEAERRQWLFEINRIHEEEYKQRQKELSEQIQWIEKFRSNNEEE